MSLESLQRLDVWRKATAFAVEINREVLPLLPPEEKWAMAQQLRRASQCIPANIAEGNGRYYYQDNIRFCYIARGSLQETISFLSLAFELDYLPKELFDKLFDHGNDISRLINGYTAYLKKSKQGANDPGAQHSIKEPPDYYQIDYEEETSEE